MGFLGHPILLRELREQARRPTTHLLRCAAVVLLVGGTYLLCDPATLRNLTTGRDLFIGLNRLVFALIWCLGPLMTADCLSEEKRSATLGLLFLTPLRPVEVVLAKASAHFLRGITLLLSAAPILVAPLILGGVSGWEIVRMALYQAAALVLSASAGLLASSGCRSEASARTLALGIALVSAVVLLSFHLTAGALVTCWGTPSLQSLDGFLQAWTQRYRILWWSSGIPYGQLRLLPTTLQAPKPGWAEVVAASGVLVAGCLVAAGVVWAAAVRLARTWRPAEAFAQRRVQGSGSLRPVGPIPGEAVAEAWARRVGGLWLHPALWLAVGLVVGGIFHGAGQRGHLPFRELVLVTLAAGLTSVTHRRCFPDGFGELVETTPLTLRPLGAAWLTRCTWAALSLSLGALAGTHLGEGRPRFSSGEPALAVVSTWLLLPTILVSVPRLVVAGQRFGLPEPLLLTLPALLLPGVQRWALWMRVPDPVGSATLQMAVWMAVFFVTNRFAQPGSGGPRRR